ncbi:MAG: antibiotic biosynthesis monooxygenase [Oscillospiraceae bacterium]|jgi:quinol monooxygenase YgiN|nr:antibiotic biosynthesis monooxygenase [Oscillospiraceae bacterium]
MSIKVVAENFVKTDGLDKYLELNREMIEATHKLDAGCISYALHRDLADPTHYTMLEEWESQESLDSHLKSEHFLRLIPQIMTFSDPSKHGGIATYEKVIG